MKLQNISAVAIAATILFTACSSANTRTPNTHVTHIKKVSKDKKQKPHKLTNKERKELKKQAQSSLPLSNDQINNLSSIESTKEKLSHQNAYYVSDDIKQGLKDNYTAPDAPPLYLNPTFAKITIFPYVTKSGIYHSYEEVWVKINDGRFVLNQQDYKKAKK